MSGSVTVYLAGPVQHVNDHGTGWRDRVVESYSDGFDLLDPLDKYHVPVDNLTLTSVSTDADDEVSVGEIVTSDKAMIDDADAVLVRWMKVPSCGTPMEVLYAYERDIPVVVCDLSEGRISPWMEHHATHLTDSLEEALSWVRTHVGGDD